MNKIVTVLSVSALLLGLSGCATSQSEVTMTEQSDVRLASDSTSSRTYEARAGHSSNNWERRPIMNDWMDDY